MHETFTLEEGKSAVRLARKVIECYVRDEKVQVEREKFTSKFNLKYGVFVTIDTYPQRKLRGCIGYPEPIFPLLQAIIESAENAANDPRFEPLREIELDKIVIEVSILTPPELIKVDKPLDYKHKIKIGTDGLIVEKGYYKGLLLPQVAIEWKWNEEEFLTNTCIKAGLSPEEWLRKDLKIYKFQAQIFSETTPRGEIIERKLLSE
jgi:hypothetical protein